MIKDYKWYGSSSLTVPSATAPMEVQLDIISWAVLQWDNFNNKFSAYIWVWTSGDEKLDIQEIIDWWNRISKQEALWIFWNQNYEWWDIENDYKLN